MGLVTATAELLRAADDTLLEANRLLWDLEQEPGRRWLAEQDAMLDKYRWHGYQADSVTVRPMLAVIDQPSDSEWMTYDAMRWSPEMEDEAWHPLPQITLTPRIHDFVDEMHYFSEALTRQFAVWSQAFAQISETGIISFSTAPEWRVATVQWAEPVAPAVTRPEDLRLEPGDPDVLHFGDWLASRAPAMDPAPISWLQRFYARPPAPTTGPPAGRLR